MSLSKLWPEIIKLFPARESLVSDIPAGEGKNNLFLQCVNTGNINIMEEDRAIGRNHLTGVAILSLSDGY
jgi:hypothetical protein